VGLNDFVKKTKDIVQDKANALVDPSTENLVLEALVYFSKDCPQIVVADIAGAGEFEYDLPATWVNEESNMKSVEYPQGERIPIMLEPGDWMIYKTTSDEKLRFLNDSPIIGEDIRVTFSKAWTKSTIDSIPAAKQGAFIVLAAARCCDALARTFAQSADSTINVDVSDKGSISDRYARRAKELITQYNDLMGKKKGVKAAIAQGEWDTLYPWGMDRLTHPRRYR
jgi:hypothetical protein